MNFKIKFKDGDVLIPMPRVDGTPRTLTNSEIENHLKTNAPHRVSAWRKSRIVRNQQWQVIDQHCNRNVNI